MEEDSCWTDMQENCGSVDMFMDQTEVMNQPMDHIWLNCTICVLTTMVNIWAIKVLTTKANTNTKKLVNLDCVSNIMISVETVLFTLDVGFPLNISAICAVRNATFMSLIAFTRLVPVAIVVLRYIMVCHPVIFQNCGKEKGFWKWILGSVTVLCLAIWILNIYNSSISYRFLRCVGREEDYG